MGKFGGFTLKLLQTFIYVLAFCCGAIILGFYSYFLALQADRDAFIPEQNKAVEGISGAAVLYTIFAVLFTCCLGGISFFAFLAIVLDILFTGGFIALAVLTRYSRTCSADFVRTPLGDGPRNFQVGSSTGNPFDGSFGVGEGDNFVYAVRYSTACRYNQACFAVSIIGAFLFAVSALVQVFLGRHHQKEKRYGPSPSNNYTQGSGNRKFWQRRAGPKTTHEARDAEMAAGVDKPANGAGGYHTAPSTNY